MAELLLFQEITWLEGWTRLGVVATAIMTLATVLATLALITTSIKTLRTDGWEGLKAMFRPFKARREDRKVRDAKLDSLSDRVDEVLCEIKPNGGKSLRDRVDTIGDQVESIGAWTHHQKETSDLPIFKLDETGRLTFANCAFRELVGAEEDDLRYRFYLSRIEIGDRTRLMQEIDQSIENLMPFDSTVHFKNEGPNFTAVRLQATPDVRHGGVLKGFFGTASKHEPVGMT